MNENLRNSNRRLYPNNLDNHKKAESSDHAGHRERLKKRFDEVGLDGLAEHEILEMFLFYIFRQGDTKSISKRLLKEFGSLDRIFNANIDQLCGVTGLGIASSRFVVFFRALMARLSREKMINTKPVISSGSVLMEYLGVTMESKPEEELMIIFLDNHNRVIKDEVLSVGTETQTAVYPKKILKRAMMLHSTGIIVVHNHPSGDLTPSTADIQVTKKLVSAACALDIRILDHVIVGPKEATSGERAYYSFRDGGFL